MKNGEHEEFTFKPLTQGLGFRNSMLSNASIDSILESVRENKSRKIEIKPVAEYEIAPTKFEPLAGFLDALLVTTGFLASLICLVAITGAELSTVFSQFDFSVAFALVAVFCWFGFSYLFLSRAILGSTFGEWAFDQILGTPHQQQKKSFYFFLALRSAASALSGFVLIPVFNLITKRDLFTYFTPLKLWQVNGTRYNSSRT